MAWDFPVATTTGQQFTPAPGVTYQWNGYAWDLMTQGTIIASGAAQQVYAESTAYQGIATTMAGGGDTIPQQTDGTQVITATITPKVVGNILRIEIVVPFSIGSAQNVWIGLFQDSNANAVAATMIGPAAASYLTNGVLNYEMPVAALAATTFKVRMGLPAAASNTIYVNGDNSSRRLGGSMRATLTITEYSPVITPAPTFTGGRVLLATRVINNQVSIDFLSLMDATYDEYEVDFFGLQMTTNHDNFALRVGEGGVIQTATSYSSSYLGINANGVAVQAPNSQGGLNLIYPGQYYNGINYPVSGRVTISKPSASGVVKNIEWWSLCWNDTVSCYFYTRGGGAWVGDTNPIDSLRFYAGGNMIAGTLKLYGVR